MPRAHKRALDSQDLGASIDNDKARPKGVQASLRPLSTGSGPVAIVPPAEKVQLAPVVQPLALVPYSSQKQPLFIQEEQKVKQNSPQLTEKRLEKVASKKPIMAAVLTMLCILALVIMIIGDFFLQNILSLANGQGITYIAISLLDAVNQGSFFTISNIVEAALLASFVLHIILLIILVSLRSSGVSFAVKILAFIITVLQLGTAIFCYNVGTANLGIYISAGLALVIMLASFSAKRE